MTEKSRPLILFWSKAIVWDSGEVELSFGTANEPCDEHHEIDSSSELDELLTRLVEMVE